MQDRSQHGLRLSRIGMAARPLLFAISASPATAQETATPKAAPQTHGSRPNIVIILADDLGYGDPRCYHKGSKVPTPNVDDLAKQGVRFTDAHTPSSVCSPTRYGLLTGRYAWRTSLKKSVLWPYDPPLIEKDRVTLPGLLGKLGSGGFTKPANKKPGPDDPQGQLYNLDQDPTETVNLYDAHPKIVTDLRALLKRCRREKSTRLLH